MVSEVFISLHCILVSRVEGGMLHVHGNVNDSEEFSWSEYVVKSIRSIVQSEGIDNSCKVKEYLNSMES